MTRKEFMQTVAGAGAAAYLSGSATAAPAPGKPKLGVTVYSWGTYFHQGRITLEECIAEIADMGAEGVEILGEAHIPNYPNPPASFIKQWFGWMDKYHTKPAAYDTFVDTMFYKHRNLNTDEAAARLVVDFKLANQLGIKALRQQWPPYPADNKEDEINAPYVKSKLAMETIMKALPSAEKYDVRMGIELHSPTQLKSAFIDSIVEQIQKTGTKHFGFCPDLSAFTRRPQRNTKDNLVRQGARENIVDYIIQAYTNRVGPEKTVAEVTKMGGNEAELRYAGIAGIYHNSNNDPKDLLPLIPYCYHCHAKFHEIQDDLTEYTIPYDEVLPVFVQGGYNGYLDSELEGGTPGASTTGTIRAHQAMMRKYLGMT